MSITKLRFRNLTLLLGSTLTVMAGAILAPALPDMVVAFQQVPNVEMLVRLTLTLPALFIAISSPFVGILLDRWGRKPVIIFSLILFGISGISGYFFDSLILILIGRAILGIATGGITSGITTLIGDYFSGTKLNQFMGYQGVFIGIGGMAYLLVGGYLADVAWQLVFLVYLVSFVVLPGVIIAVNEPIRKTELPGDTEAIKDIETKVPFREIGFVYFISIIGMILFFAFPIYLPFYMVAKGEITNSQIGILLSLSTATSIITAWKYQKIKSKLSFVSVVALFLLIIGINHLVVANGESYNVIAIGMLIGGFGIGLLPPNQSVWIISLAPPQLRGRIIGGITTALFLGQFLTPIVIQPIIDTVGMGMTFNYMGGFAILLSIVLSIYSRFKASSHITN